MNDEDLTPGQQLAESIWLKIEALADDERKVFFDTICGEWCRDCGRQHPGRACQCWNDE